MKNIFTAVVCLIIAVCIITCKKNTTTSPPPSATCTTCNFDTAIAHLPDTTGMYYYLPNAFTPYGTLGLNAVFGLIYNNLNADSSKLTIWDLDGNGVFSGPITQTWNGNNLNGVACAPGNYPVYVRIWTKTGKVTELCTCVTILAYKGTCIPTNGVTYYFADQLDTTAGFTKPTKEDLCP